MPFVNVTTAFNKMISGNETEVLHGIVSPLTQIMGNYFWFILLFIALIIIYIKTQSFSTTMIVGLLCSAGILALMPIQTHFLIYAFVALGITIILYKVFH